MAQVINTNVGALFAGAALNKSAIALQTAQERLSSGLRINSAKDDITGLGIANGLRHPDPRREREHSQRQRRHLDRANQGRLSGPDHRKPAAHCRSPGGNARRHGRNSGADR